MKIRHAEPLVAARSGNGRALPNACESILVLGTNIPYGDSLARDLDSAMNPRHAAALALVGWYLMVPPLKCIDKSDNDLGSLQSICGNGKKARGLLRRKPALRSSKRSASSQRI
jgi:hypothetical protein